MMAMPSFCTNSEQIRSNLPLKRLSSPNAFSGDPDFKDFKDWIPDYYLGNDKI